MNEDMCKMFTRLYLTSEQPKVRRCYTDLCAWVKTYYLEWLTELPSERSFRRRTKTITDCVIAYTRRGEKYCFDKYTEYINRDYTDLQANEIWISDNHTLDIQSTNSEGIIHRLYVTTFQDVKTMMNFSMNCTRISVLPLFDVKITSQKTSTMNL